MGLTDGIASGRLPLDARGQELQTTSRPVFTQRAAAGTTLTSTSLNSKTTHVAVWGLAASAATTAAIKVSDSASGGVTVPAGQVLTVPVAGLSAIYTAAYTGTADIQIMELRLE